MKYTLRVYHDEYGCDTGCCGHTVQLTDEEGKIAVREFNFTHNYSHVNKISDNQWAVELATNVISKRYPECLKYIDWDSIELDVKPD